MLVKGTASKVCCILPKKIRFVEYPLIMCWTDVSIKTYFNVLDSTISLNFWEDKSINLSFIYAYLQWLRRNSCISTIFETKMKIG